MNNPELTTVTVTDAATLVFSGCGNVRIQNIGANSPNFGPSTVAYTSSTFYGQDSIDMRFDANGEVYARCASGLSTTVRVLRWF